MGLPRIMGSVSTMGEGKRSLNVEEGSEDVWHCW